MSLTAGCSLSMVLLLFYSVIQRSSGDTIARQDYNEDKVAGDVLVLSVGSLTFKGSHPTTMGLVSVEKCADYCKNTPGCNAFTFCNKSDGCPGDCFGWVNKHPQVRDITPTTPLPIRGFGPWPYPYGGNGCHYNMTAGRPVNRWPSGLCSLLIVENAKKPRVVRSAHGTGWVSGTFVRPANCSSQLSVVGCELCHNSLDQAECRQCSLEAKQGALEVLMGGASRELGCGMCYGIVDEEDRKTCRRCVVERKDCGHCACRPSLPGRDYGSNVAACIHCVTKTGMEQACVACAQSSTGAGQCMDCLHKLHPRFCNATNPKGTDCIPSYSSICQTCAKATNSYDRCLQCALTSPYSTDCEYCGLLRDPQHQEGCYDCALAVQAAGSTACYECYENHGSTSQERCLQCVQDPKIPSMSKYWCNGCVNWYTDRQQQDKCFQCLQGGSRKQCQP